MTAWGPQTRAGNVKCIAPNYAADKRIQGFRGSHFLTGSCIQMSAWYVMSALGFYAVNPGTPVYEVGVPRFDEAVIRLANGKQFRIRAAGTASGKPYIHSATLNGVPLNRYWIKHSEIVNGGELVFEMSSEPNKAWPEN